MTVVTCAIDYVAKGTVTPVLHDYLDSKKLYVVGGPLALGVSGGYPGTPTRDPAPPVAPGQPQGKAGPWYVEYFGFDPSGTKPQGAQDPQNGTVAAYIGQPAGTTYEWTVPAPLVRMDRSTVSDPQIGVGATAGSGGSPIQVRCKYKFDNGDPNDPVTGTCMDDSDETPDADGQPNVAPYRFDAHKPERLMLDGSTGLLTSSTQPPPTPYWWENDYTYHLVDDGGARMGWVYIVERFTSGQAYNNAISLWPPNADGTIVDSLWIQSSTPTTTASFDFMHYYFAATTDTGLYGVARSGILVLTTRTKVSSSSITNDEQPWRP